MQFEQLFKDIDYLTEYKIIDNVMQSFNYDFGRGRKDSMSIRYGPEQSISETIITDNYVHKKNVINLIDKIKDKGFYHLEKEHKFEEIIMRLEELILKEI